MQFQGLNCSLTRILLATSLAAVSGCGDSKSKKDNEAQFDAMDYALAAEYSRLPNAVVIRVPLDGYGTEQASAASMRSYYGSEMVTDSSDLAGIYENGRNPGHLISTLAELTSEGSSTQSWGAWQQQQQQQQGMPYQSPVQGPGQSPVQTSSKKPYQGIFKGKQQQQQQQRQCCKAKHDPSKPFFDLFKSKKPRCGSLGPLLKPRKCMAVPAQQIPVVNGPVIGGTQISVEQPMIMNQQQQGSNPGQQQQGYYPTQQQSYYPTQSQSPYYFPDQQPYYNPANPGYPGTQDPNGQVPVVSPGPTRTTQNQNVQFLQFQPRAYSNVNDNGYWGYGQAVTATYGQTRYYAYPRPVCDGAAWCALVK